MEGLILHSGRVDLILQSPEATLSKVDALAPEVKAEISPKWLAMVRDAKVASPWIHWFSVMLRSSSEEIGACGFKGPPDSDGVIEIAYGIEPDFQGQGYATEAARGLAHFALQQCEVAVVRAHTLLDGTASQRVLAKCGFQLIGEVQDPEDGLVLRWELRSLD